MDQKMMSVAMRKNLAEVIPRGNRLVVVAKVW